MTPLVCWMGGIVTLALIALLLASFGGRDVSIEEIQRDLFDQGGSS